MRQRLVGGSSNGIGAPNTTSRPSPRYLSVSASREDRFDYLVEVLVRMSRTRSAGAVSVNAVKPCMSVNMIVLDGPAPGETQVAVRLGQHVVDDVFGERNAREDAADAPALELVEALLREARVDPGPGAPRRKASTDSPPRRPRRSA